jgi:hypothetical protein
MQGGNVMEMKSRDDTIPSREEFDVRSGSFLERIIFNNRRILVLACALVTAYFGWSASSLEVNASFTKMIPTSSPYIKNYLDNVASLRGLGNSVRIVVENKKGDIYDKEYLETLKKINDSVFLMPGVDRAYMKSLWRPNVRWNEITEEGTRGGSVMPDRYKGTDSDIAELQRNVTKANLLGSIVASDLHSSMVFVPLLDKDPVTGKQFDYAAFSHNLENQIRSVQSDSINIYIVGFAKLVGDLIDGLWQVLSYFAIAAVIATAIIFWFTRCVRSALSILCCSLIAVVWQLGIFRLLGFVLDPYSVLVPFLVFAIGVSHGAQKMNGIMEDIGRGAHRYVAARYTFRRLFLAGFSALAADAVGFAVLMTIDIPVIYELAIAASIGVTVLIFTNLILLPVLLSYIGVGRAAALRSVRNGEPSSAGFGFFSLLDRCTERRWAIVILSVTAVVTFGGFLVSLNLQVGDLDPGAPELRANSRYNKDVVFVTSHYGLSSDQFAVIVKAPNSGLTSYTGLVEMDRLEERLRKIPGVRATVSAASMIRFYTAANFEGNPKWMTINRDPYIIADAINNIHIDNPEMINAEYTVAPLVAYLTDHKAETLTSVVREVEDFAATHNTDKTSFLLAAGSAGIEAATNIVVDKSSHRMLYLVYAAVIGLCYLSFRSWLAVVVAVIPLVITSILCEALMVFLGIGVKVATLPVIALGVGIGVDYALYLLSIQLAYQRVGDSLADSYRKAVRFTGKVVALVGVTLAASVATWALSPIKFQADMGILLAFMFLWNMVGALVLIPALSHFLLSRKHQPKPGAEILTHG